jgi:2-dehydro-3-deoxy-D-arabinonate dehydratase
MHYYQATEDGASRLLAADGSDVYDLTSVRRELDSFAELARAASISSRSIDEIASTLSEEADPLDSSILDDVDAPIVPPEVWAAGVTYGISEQAREEESGMPEMYLDVYEAERPEIFFKATPDRMVGPREEVGIRGDSEWDVPEPELGVVLYEGDIVGYTIGNDMSSRSIEGKNPLYLPQAKVYDRCCALGPCVVSAEEIDDPHDLEMSMTIERDGETLYDDATSTGEMVRTCEELVDYYTSHNSVPETSVLLTGTSLVPEDDFTLRAGDRVTIDIEAIGTLENVVTVV